MQWPGFVGALYTTSVEDMGWLSCAVGGGYVLRQLAGGFGVRYLPKMKWQTLVCAVMITVFFSALASSNPKSRSRSLVFFTLGMIGGGYIENLLPSAMALVWEPDDIGLVSGVLCAI